MSKSVNFTANMKTINQCCIPFQIPVAMKTQHLWVIIINLQSPAEFQWELVLLFPKENLVSLFNLHLSAVKAKTLKISILYQRLSEIFLLEKQILPILVQFKLLGLNNSRIAEDLKKSLLLSLRWYLKMM